MGYQLTLLLEPQQEGGYTITCKELPELITECDSLDELRDNVIDAFTAVVELYEYKQRKLPESIFYSEQAILETVVAFSEVSKNSQTTKTTWL